MKSAHGPVWWHRALPLVLLALVMLGTAMVAAAAQGRQGSQASNNARNSGHPVREHPSNANNQRGGFPPVTTTESVAATGTTTTTQQLAADSAPPPVTTLQPSTTTTTPPTTGTTATTTPPTTTATTPTTTTTTTTTVTTTTTTPPPEPPPWNGPSGVVKVWDLETGDFSQFGLNGTNASSRSGDASKEIITTTVKQGNYALRLTSEGQGSAERMRQDRAVPGGVGARNLPEDGYWSVWFYPETYASMGEGNASINFFQFKQKYLDDENSLTSRYMYAWYLMDVGVEGEYGIKLKTRVSPDGQKWGNEYKRVLGSSELSGNRIKVGEWNRIEVRYKYGDNGTGRVTTWINGALVWDLPNQTTEFLDWPWERSCCPYPDSYRHQHLFNVYIVGSVSPSTQSIVFDDGRVQTTRRGN